jgi:hypothetical protein
MPQPIAYNTGSQTSGSIKLFGIEYAVSSSIVSGSNNQRWFSSVNPGNGVTFVTSNVTQSFGTYATSVPLFFTASDYTAAAITGAINGLPDRYNQPIFTTTASAYAWVQNSGKYFMMNYEYPQIVTRGLVYEANADFLASYPRSQSLWYDISGRGNSGSLVNNVSFTNVGALGFDGVDDYVLIPYNPSMQPTTALTMETWVYLNAAPPSWYSVFQSPQTNGAHTNPYFDWAIYINANLGLHTRIDGKGAPGGGGTTITKMQSQRWTQTVISWEAGSAYFYLNGQLIQTTGSLPTSITYDNNTNKIIGANAALGEDLNGYLSNVRLYNTRLSNAEIAQNYYQGPVVTDGLVFAVDPSNLISYDTTGTLVYSLPTQSFSGSLTNGASFNRRNGGSFVFDGTNDYLGYLSTPDALEGDPNLTICGFFRRTGNLTQDGIFGIGGEATDGGINCWNFNNTNEITIDTWNRSTFTTGVTYPLNEWVFVAWQKIAGAMTRANCIVWRNLTSYTGAQLTVLRAEGPAPNINNYGVTLGSISRTTSYCAAMDVGNFFVYNRVLTPAEIAQNFNAYKSKFGLW